MMHVLATELPWLSIKPTLYGGRSYYAILHSSTFKGSHWAFRTSFQDRVPRIGVGQLVRWGGATSGVVHASIPVVSVTHVYIH